ncbi:uncharacterized protein LOC101853805 [Aplysia californica]|uniref:Uncharacterized protein LOC101853805 n=1 Tax=Aplysia californica TaxID=6500 RepID=A0ABM0JY81_APLCA|nr:uncharacterized protein LOC101853805 [Aplysia californica]
MYNHLGNEVSRIQKMGRCRQADGVSVLMAMPKDKPRDYLNRVKAGLVNSALKTIQNKGKDFQERVEQYMQSNLALTTARPSTQLNQTVLEFECKRCHRLAVESCDLRIISKHHRAVVNGDILDNIIVKYKAPKEYVQLRSIASVHCKNKGCENAIGTLYIYERTPFVVLQRKNLSCPRLGKPKWTWEDVKRIGCLCADIQSQDIKEYLSGKCDQWYECEPTSVSAAKRRKLSAGSQPLPTPESDTRQAEERAANLNLAATTKAADSGTEDVKMAEELTEEDEERLLGEPTDFNTTAIGEIFEDLDEKADKFLGEAPDLESLSMNVPSDSGPNQSYNCEVPENTESSLSLLISH